MPGKLTVGRRTSLGLLLALAAPAPGPPRRRLLELDSSYEALP